MKNFRNLEKEIKRVKTGTIDDDLELSQEDIENAMNELCQKGLVVKNEDGSFSLVEDVRAMSNIIDLEEATGMSFEGMKEQIEDNFEGRKEKK